jgi:hypothetical protein
MAAGAIPPPLFFERGHCRQLLRTPEQQHQRRSRIERPALKPDHLAIGHKDI